MPNICNIQSNGVVVLLFFTTVCVCVCVYRVSINSFPDLMLF